MKKLFSVYRAGFAKRKLLDISISTKVSRIKGNKNLVRSLQEEGVTDLKTGKTYSIQTKNMSYQQRKIIFDALRQRFERDSAYQVKDQP